MRMESGSDVEDHINKMHAVYERLNSLVTLDHPLTVDDIYATALVISIPEDWVSLINGLLLNPSTDFTATVDALKRQATYRKARIEKDSTNVSVSCAGPSTSKPSNSEEGSKGRRFCQFCRRHGHDLLNCNNAREILLKARKESGSSHRDDTKSDDRSKSRSKSKSTKAAFVELVTDDEEDSDGSVEARSAHPTSAQTTRSDEANIDLGCGKSMTPHLHDLTGPVPKKLNV